MKKVFFGAAIFSVLGLIYAFTLPKSTPAAGEGEKITWYSWEEAVALAEKTPKKLFVDVYTDWCGWCKRMDVSTFTDAEVIKYMNANYYPVKFNAEQTGEVQYKGHTLKFVAQGRRGYHELAAALLDGQMSYPNFVYLDEEQKLITRSPGYKTPDVLIKELKYIGENAFKEKSYEDYIKGN